jgi:hypothetical protein
VHTFAHLVDSRPGSPWPIRRHAILSPSSPLGTGTRDIENGQYGEAFQILTGALRNKTEDTPISPFFSAGPAGGLPPPERRCQRVALSGGLAGCRVDQKHHRVLPGSVSARTLRAAINELFAASARAGLTICEEGGEASPDPQAREVVHLQLDLRPLDHTEARELDVGVQPFEALRCSGERARLMALPIWFVDCLGSPASMHGQRAQVSCHLVDHHTPAAARCLAV